MLNLSSTPNYFSYNLLSIFWRINIVALFYDFINNVLQRYLKDILTFFKEILSWLHRFFTDGNFKQTFFIFFTKINIINRVINFLKKIVNIDFLSFFFRSLKNEYLILYEINYASRFRGQSLAVFSNILNS